MPDDEMTAPEAAAYLGIHKSVVTRAINSGRIKARRVGARMWLIPRDEVEAYDVTRRPWPAKGPKAQAA